MTTYYIYWALFELYDIFVPESDDYYEEEYKETNDRYIQKSLNYPGIYQIYARHPVHGSEALLYMGVATNAVWERLWEHFSNSESQIDLQDEQDVRIRVGHVLEGRHSKEVNKDIPKEELEDIEKTLIWVCSPAYNARNIQEVILIKDVYIYNSGDFGAIPGEISHDYHRWDTKYDK